MRRGITCEISNDSGRRFLGSILKPFVIERYDWWIGGEEAYLVVNNEGYNALFPQPIDNLDGEILKGILEENDYYVIFQDLKAFPKGEDTKEIRTYEEYLLSNCQLVLLVVDSIYITIYCKNKVTIEDLYNNARNLRVINLEYITDDNDMRTGLSVW